MFKTFLRLRRFLAIFLINLFLFSSLAQANSADYQVISNVGPGNYDWYSIASSSDGTKLAACVYGGYIYTSTDSGDTWIERTSVGSRSWLYITSSSDGEKLAAVAEWGYIYTSTDSGQTWVERTSSGVKPWWSIASSSDGTRLAAVDTNSYIFTSTDSGASWTERTSAGSRSWYSIASSSDGLKLAAANSYNGYIYTSIDGGANWETRDSIGLGNWCSIASSSDGSKLAAVPFEGYIKISNDSGATWETNTSAGQKRWDSITMSGDGQKIAAVSSQGEVLCISRDGGQTWDEFIVDAFAITVSLDGNKFATAAYGGYINRFIYSPSSEGTGLPKFNYTFNRNGEVVTYQSSKDSSSVARLVMNDSALTTDLLENNFTDLITMENFDYGKPFINVPVDNPIAQAVNNGEMIVTATFYNVTKPVIMLNGKQITNTQGKVFPGYENYIRNVNYVGTTLTFEIMHFSEYGIPVLVGKTFVGTAADQAINADGADIVVNYSTGSVSGDANHDRSTTVLGIHGLAYETVLTDAPSTLNNLYKSLVPGTTYNVSFEYINRGNDTDQVDLTTSIVRTNAGHFNVSNNQNKNVAPWQVVSFNVEMDADNALAYERATVDVTVALNGVTATSYNSFEDAYKGGTFGNDGQYGGVTNLQHRFVLEAEGYSISILSRAITVNAPLDYTGDPVSETNIVPGAKVKYTIVLKNNNNSVATSVNLTDIIPDNCHLYYTETPAVEGAAMWAWRGATDNNADKNTADAVKYEMTIPAQGRVTASYSVTVD